jgi:Transposase
MAEYATLLGIDWSDKKHDLCLIDTATGKREASILPHSPQEIDQCATALRARCGGQSVAICLERPRGPLIYALLKYDFLTFYPVNPRTPSKFREAFSPSRHKDDPPDAPTSPNCCCTTAGGSAPGCPTTSAPAPCACSSSTAGGWSARGPASATA